MINKNLHTLTDTEINFETLYVTFWCLPLVYGGLVLLTSDFRWSQRWGKRSRHSRRTRNPRFYVSGKRPIECWKIIVVCAPMCCSGIHCAHWTKCSGISPWRNHTTDTSWYNRPYVLNGIDIWTICWPQKDINFRTGRKSLTYLCCMRGCSILHKIKTIRQHRVSMCRLNEAWGFHQHNSEQLGLSECGTGYV